MSVWIISKPDLDAYVSIAYRWTERGDTARMPREAAEVLTVTLDNASEVGKRLWAANHDAFNYGGPRRLCHPELLAEIEAEGDPAQMPDFQFEPFPGTPEPETAMNRAHYYSYQTAGDYWENADEWPNGEPPFELRYTIAMQWYALVLLEVIPDSHPLSFDGSFPPDNDVHRWPRYEQSGHLLENSDRDLFLRVG